MPLYEYECTKCGKHLERIEKFSGPNIKKCPTCGGKLERLLSAPAIQFKGSGWYVNDYGKAGASADAKKATDREGGEKPQGKSESNSGEKSSSESKSSGDGKESKDSKDKKKSETKKK